VLGALSQTEQQFIQCKFIIIGRTALFEPLPSLEDSARLHPVCTSLDFVNNFLLSKVASLVSNP
jgi:hypothetical protein